MSDHQDNIRLGDALPDPAHFLSYALYHASRDIAVFPLTRNGRQPAIRRYFERATSDADAIHGWWGPSGSHVGCNVGIATGAEIATGQPVWCLDVDNKHGHNGDAALRQLEDELGAPLPATYAEDTPNGGRHLLFRWPAGREVKSSGGELGDGLDVRGYRGVVFAAGSVVDGRAYVVSANLPIADAPDALVDLVERRTREYAVDGVVRELADGEHRRVVAYGENARRAACERLANAQPGEQNNELFKFARQMSELGQHGLFTRYEIWCDATEAMTENGYLLDDPGGSFERTFNSGWDNAEPRAPWPPWPSDAARIESGEIEVWPPPQRPVLVARELIARWSDATDWLLRRRWRQWWLRYDEVAHRWIKEENDKIISNSVWTSLEHAVYGPERRDWNPSIKNVANVVSAFESFASLSWHQESHTWIEQPDGYPPAESMIVVKNGQLHLPSRSIWPHDPRLFNHVSLPFDYDPQAPAPSRWLRFLNELWPDDPVQQLMLQEMFGYIISGRTDLQKIMLLIGRPRSGKGTISWVLRQLLGSAVAAPSMGSLRTQFGLQDLLDKSLAIIGDARISGDTQPLIERLLTISGEDIVTVDRKNRSPLSVVLTARFLILTNEEPVLRDASGAMASRFVPLRLRQSFLGHEDLRLKATLRPELPGILTWALDGLDRLLAQGSFTLSETSNELIADMTDSGSPIGAFVRECCVLGGQHEVPRDKLYDAWRNWAIRNDVPPSDNARFGRNLRTVADVRTLRRGPAGSQVYHHGGIDLTDEYQAPTWNFTVPG